MEAHGTASVPVHIHAARHEAFDNARVHLRNRKSIVLYAPAGSSDVLLVDDVAGDKTDLMLA